MFGINKEQHKRMSDTKAQSVLVKPQNEMRFSYGGQAVIE